MRLAFRGYLEITHREFHSVELARCLHSENVAFVLRQKGDTFIQEKGRDFQPLNSIGLMPGMKRFLTGIKVTKSKGFVKQAIACYWKRKSQGKN